MQKTRIKFCGLTHPTDVLAAVKMGIDYVGFVFYQNSARAVTAAQAADLRRLLPSYVQAVGLFVNASRDDIVLTNRTVGLDILQFHGDESRADCESTFTECRNADNTRAYWQALRLKAIDDLLPWANAEKIDVNHVGRSTPEGLLLDSFSPQFGGSGHGFDWSWVEEGSTYRPANIPLIASGGLKVDNVIQAIGKIKPFAVDVSSGIQTSDPRRKDVTLMERFVEQVMRADAMSL
jgi:phosphoribosylanthranilate isomerase